MLGPVSAWVGDRLWTGKPRRHKGVNRHIAWYTSPYPWSRSIHWCMAGGLACRDQSQCMGFGSTLEALHDDALYKYTFTLRYFTLLY